MNSRMSSWQPTPKPSKKNWQKNRAEARKLAFLEMSKEDTYENAVAEIPVTFEGTWSRRGYSANHCSSFVILAASGNQKKVSCSQEEFEEWLRTRDCQGSYGGSSSSMEMECTKQLWQRSAHTVLPNVQVDDLQWKSKAIFFNMECIWSMWHLQSVWGTGSNLQRVHTVESFWWVQRIGRETSSGNYQL